MDEPHDWLKSIAFQLQENETSTSSLRELIENYTHIYTQHLHLTKAHNDFRDSLKSKEEFSDSLSFASKRSVSSVDLHSPSFKQEKFELEKQINGLNQKLHQLHTTILEQEKINRRLYTDLQQSQNALREIQKKYNDNVVLLTAKDEAIQIVQDEFTAIQLELSTKEKENEMLKRENRELLDRWLQKKAEEVEAINQENEMSATEVVAEKLGSLSIAFKGALKNVFDYPPTAANVSGIGEPFISWPSKGQDPSSIPQSILKTIRAHEDEALCLAVSLDGQYLGTGGGDRYVKLWLAKSGQPVTTLTTALSSILALQFGTNSIVSASSDNIVRLYQPIEPAPKLIHTFTGHVGKVTGVTISGNESKIFSCSGDRTIKVWDIAKAYCMKTIFAYSHCFDLVSCDYGALSLVSAHYDGKIRVWDTHSGNLANELSLAKKDPCVSIVAKDVNQIIALSKDNIIRLIDLRSMQIIPLGSAYMKIGQTKIGMSPGGNYVSVGAADGSIFVWDLRTKEHIVLAGGHGSQVNHVQWHSLTGSKMFSIDKTGNLTFWGSSI